MVRQRSAKPLFPSSNLGVASTRNTKECWQINILLSYSEKNRNRKVFQLTAFLHRNHVFAKSGTQEWSFCGTFLWKCRWSFWGTQFRCIIIGKILYWCIEKLRYIEHFCILPSMRNQHYGQKILAALQEELYGIEADGRIPNGTVGGWTEEREICIVKDVQGNINCL